MAALMSDLALLGPPLSVVQQSWGQRSRLAPQPLRLPLALEAVAAGFPSPASDYIEASIDLNLALVPHPSSTFFLRVQGDAMTAAGIHHGDLLVVDRSVEPRRGSTVVVVHAGELLLRRLEGHAPRWRLVAADPAIPALRLDGDDPHVLVWGVVIHAVHHLQRLSGAGVHQNP